MNARPVELISWMVYGSSLFDAAEVDRFELTCPPKIDVSASRKLPSLQLRARVPKTLEIALLLMCKSLPFPITPFQLRDIIAGF
jgi:hypothetical protein